MAGRVQEGVCLGDGHALGTSSDLDDLVAGSYLPFLEDANVETWFPMRDEQRCHSRLIHSDPNPIACHAGLGHFEYSTSDLVSVADAYLVVGQAFDGEVFTKLSEDEVISVELSLPIAMGLNLVDENCTVLTAVTDQVSLPIAIDVELPHHPSALNRVLPDGRFHGLTAPCDVAWKTYIDREQPGHDCLLSCSEQARIPTRPHFSKPPKALLNVSSTS